MIPPITPLTYLVVLPLVFLGGFIDAAAGGGGLISLPAYLLVGLPPQMAIGTNKGGAMFGAAAATLRFQKARGIDWSAAVAAVPMAFIGSYIGAQIQMLLPPTTVRIVIAVLLPAVAIPLLRNRNLAPRRTLSPTPLVRLLLCGAVGLVTGAYDGFFGPGAGTFQILLFVFLCGMDAILASGTAKVVNLSSNVSAMIAYAVGGHVLWLLATPAALFSMLGGALGAHMAIRKGVGLIQPVIFVVLTLLLIRLIYDILTALV